MSENGPDDRRQVPEPRTEAAQELDARSLRCPLPVLKLRKRLQAIAEGATIVMIADDPAARIDVPHFCAEQGHELVDESEDADGALRFVVRKRGKSAAATSAS